MADMDSASAAAAPSNASAAISATSLQRTVADEVDDDSDISADSLDDTLAALQQQAAEVTGQVQQLAASCQQRQQQYSALSLQYVTLLAAAVDSYTDDVTALCDTSQQLVDGCEAIERELQDSKRVETLVANVKRQVLETEAFVELMLKDTKR